MTRASKPRSLQLSAKRWSLFHRLVADPSPDATSVAPEEPSAGPAPLSFAQERLWFLDRFQPGLAIYNMPFSIQLPRPTRLAVAERVLSEIVRRHETLRTTFAVIDGHPAQQIAPAHPVHLPVVDLRGLAAEPRHIALQQRWAQEWTHVFDLEHGPLFRVCAIRVDQDIDLLMVNLHHIISDGWSLDVFTRESSALYDAFAAERPSPLPALPRSYSDYAREQRRETNTHALAADVAFWRDRLAAAPPVIELPFDRPRPHQQSFRGETQLFRIAAPVVQLSISSPCAAEPRCSWCCSPHGRPCCIATPGNRTSSSARQWPIAIAQISSR